MKKRRKVLHTYIHTYIHTYSNKFVHCLCLYMKIAVHPAQWYHGRDAPLCVWTFPAQPPRACADTKFSV